MTGSELRRARTLANKTQKQIADEVGANKSRVCRIEKGMADRMLETYERILKAYGFRIVGPDQEWNEFEEQA